MLRVPPAPAPYLVRVRERRDAEVVVGAPDVDLVALGARIRDWELCSEAIDVVKVAVRLMFLIELTTKEGLVVKGGCNGLVMGLQWALGVCVCGLVAPLARGTGQLVAA